MIPTDFELEAIARLRGTLEARWDSRAALALDPDALTTKNQSVQNLFQGLTAEDAAARTSPDIPGTTHERVLTVLGQMLTRSVVRDRARPRPEADEPVLVREVVGRSAALRRLGLAVVSGNGAFPTINAALRKRVFRTPAPILTRASFEADFDHIIAALEAIEAEDSLDVPPTALLALLPRFRAMRQELHEVQPKTGFRTEPPPLWSEETIRLCWMLYLAHEQALIWVLANAVTDRTLSTALRLLQQRRISDLPPQQQDEHEQPSGSSDETAPTQASGGPAQTSIDPTLPGDVAAGTGTRPAGDITEVVGPPGAGAGSTPGNGAPGGATEGPSPTPGGTPPRQPC